MLYPAQRSVLLLKAQVARAVMLADDGDHLVAVCEVVSQGFGVVPQGFGVVVYGRSAVLDNLVGALLAFDCGSSATA